MSDIQDYIEYIIKKHETLTTILPICIYINRISNRLMFKVKDGYRLELQTPETMKLFGSRKNLIDKTKHRENVPNLEVVEVVLVQCNLVDNQYLRKSDVLCVFNPSKSYGYFLNVEPSNLVFLKTYNTEFDEIIITFTDQNGTLLQIEVHVNLKYVKGYGFLLFARKYKKQLLDTRLDCLKIVSKRVVHKTGVFLGNKIAVAITK